MSDTAIAIIAVSVVLLVAVILLRGKIQRIVIKVLGLEAGLTTHKPDKPSSSASVRITKTKQTGRNNKIDVERDDVEISEFVQRGKKHKLHVGPEGDKGESET